MDVNKVCYMQNYNILNNMCDEWLVYFFRIIFKFVLSLQ